MSISGYIPESQISKTGPLLGPVERQAPQEGPSVGTDLSPNSTTSSHLSRSPPTAQETKARLAQGKASANAAETLRGAEKCTAKFPVKL